MGQQTKGTSGTSDRASERAAARRRLQEGNADPSVERRREQKASDRQRAAAHEAGRRGDDPAEYQTDDELAGYYEDGQKVAKQEGRLARRDQLVGAGKDKAGGIASDGAGFLLGLIGYALIFNYLRNGTVGVKSWLSAKFINQPTMTSAGTSRAATSTNPTAASGVRGRS